MGNVVNFKKSDFKNLIKEIMGRDFSYSVLNGGHVAVTLLLEDKDEKYILQIWRNDFSNQSNYVLPPSVSSTNTPQFILR